MVFNLQNGTITSEEKIRLNKVGQPIVSATEQPHVSRKQSTPKKQLFPKEAQQDVQTGYNYEKCACSSSNIEIGQRQVYVSHIETPGKFWIQHAENQQSIVDINSELVDIGVEGNAKYFLDGSLIVGQLYAVKHPEFGNCGLISRFLSINKVI